MREIKFRAWDKENKKIVEVGDLSWWIQNDKSLIWVNSDFADRYIILEFTGLKDKNGKKIFEGDILKLKDNTLWIVEEIGSKSSDGQIGICVSPIHFKKTYLIDESIIKGEVIGNIYENPELLEEQKK